MTLSPVAVTLVKVLKGHFVYRALRRNGGRACQMELLREAG